MEKIFRRTLLCLLAVSMLAVSGNIYAENSEENNAETVSDEETQATYRAKETAEKIDTDIGLIEKYLKKTGSADGFDIYFRSENYETEIWNKNGGKPENKSDYTEKQKQLADDISELKKLGDFTIAENGKVTASFRNSTACDEGKLYVSDAKRFLLTADGEKVLNISEIISSVDDDCVYLSSDGKKLYLTDEKHRKIIGTYSDKKSDGGKRLFVSENDDSFAWTTADKKQFYGIYRYGAENDEYRMLVDERFGNFGVESKATGYIWWSSPFGASRDSIASKMITDELRSSCVLRYGIPSDRNSNNYLRSAASDCEIKVRDIKNGIRVEYSFASKGFSVPVEYTLEDGYIKESLKVGDIIERKESNRAMEITLTGAFGSADTSENGYFIVPDGCGAKVNFNNDKATRTNSYKKRIYGDDITAVPKTYSGNSQQIYLPVYASVSEKGSFLAVASKGDTNAYLSVKTSGQSGSSQNLCSFTFILRDTDDYYMSGTSNERLTMFEDGDIKSDDIEVRYYLTDKENADYNDMAQLYRQYLLDEKNVQIRAEKNDSPLYTELYGGTLKKKSFLGVPVTRKTALTDYAQAEMIISELRENGVEDLAVTYENWTNDSIESKIASSAVPSAFLGGKADFYSFAENVRECGELYPVSDNMTFLSGNSYSTSSSAAVRISGEYSRIVSYDMAYGIPDKSLKTRSLLSPCFFERMFRRTAESCVSNGIDGICISGLSTSLYGDYGKRNISRGKSAEFIADGYKMLDSSLENGVMSDNANAYLLPYVSRIKNVPLTSCRADIFDEDIPFLQLVLHGVIPYSSVSVNGSADTEKLLMMSALTGSALSCDMIYEESSEIKDTEFSRLYYADYRQWTETVSAEYSLLAPILKDVSDSFIKSYTVSEDGQSAVTEFENGTAVAVDFKKKTITHNGRTVNLEEYAKERGIAF